MIRTRTKEIMIYQGEIRLEHKWSAIADPRVACRLRARSAPWYVASGDAAYTRTSEMHRSFADFRRRAFNAETVTLASARS